jgi:hypothetical protein
MYKSLEETRQSEWDKKYEEDQKNRERGFALLRWAVPFLVLLGGGGAAAWRTVSRRE